MSRRGALALIIVGALAIGVGVYLSGRGGNDTPRPAAVPIVDRGHVPGQHDPVVPTKPVVPTRTDKSSAPHRLLAGSHLRYARLGVRATIRRVQVVDHVMQIPLDPQVLGWWTGSAAPGAQAGSVVVVGHINYGGVSGALAVLPKARPGDQISVDEPGGSVYSYRVDAVRTYPKTAGIPPSAFDTSGRAQLVLITCGGPFDPDTGNYEDNIVVYADAA